MKEVDLYTDGSCLGNPGPGGWAAILKWSTYERNSSGSKKMTTNNEMELTAVIEGIKLLNEPCIINIHSDSKYVLDAIKSWLTNWVKNNWKTSTKKDVANIELWKEYLIVSKKHTIKTHWIKGHSGHPENERCDKLAMAEAKKA